MESIRTNTAMVRIDGVEAAGNIEEYLTDHLNPPSP